MNDVDDPSDLSDRGMWRRIALPALVVAALAIAALIVVVVTDDDTDVSTSPTTTAGATTSTAAETTTSTSMTTSVPTTSVPTTSSSTPTATGFPEAVWPTAGMGTAVTDPVETARRFAVEYAGFTQPTVGAFQQGDGRSGEVEVRPRADGPVTTVLVRQLGSDGTWSVIGTATANIEIDEPAALATIADPVRLVGRARAFEGNVAVEIRSDDGTTLATGFVTGRGDGELGPFSSELAYELSPTGRGAVLFRTFSAEDGQVWEAGILRVRFPAP